MNTGLLKASDAAMIAKKTAEVEAQRLLGLIQLRAKDGKFSLEVPSGISEGAAVLLTELGYFVQAKEMRGSKSHINWK